MENKKGRGEELLKMSGKINFWAFSIIVEVISCKRKRVENLLDSGSF